MGEEGTTFEMNVARLRAGYAAFNRGDIGAVLELLDPEITWQRRDVHPIQGVRKGRDTVARDVFQSIQDQFAELVLEPVEFFDCGNHIVVRIRQRGRGRASGAIVEGELAHVLLVRGDHLAELRAFSSVEEAFEVVRS